MTGGVRAYKEEKRKGKREMIAGCWYTTGTGIIAPNMRGAGLIKTYYSIYPCEIVHTRYL